MAGFYARRGVPETLASGLTNGQSGGNQFAIPNECIGARINFQANYTGGPTNVSVPILGSDDGVNFVPVLTLSNPAGEIQVVISQAISSFKVGAVVLQGGAAPTVTVILRAS